MNGFSQRYIPALHTHMIWQRQCIKIKPPLHAACFSGKSFREGKTTLLDWSINNLLQSILPLVHKHHVTSRDSSRVSERHNFFASGSSHLGPKPTRPKPSRSKINSAQNSLGPGLRDISSLFFSFLFSFSSSFFFFFFHCLYYAMWINFP